ncbi:MAG: hypothetical protein QXP39_01945 [Candidatus Aenigmatarchaeota archaeon]
MTCVINLEKDDIRYMITCNRLPNFPNPESYKKFLGLKDILYNKYWNGDVYMELSHMKNTFPILYDLLNRKCINSITGYFESSEKERIHHNNGFDDAYIGILQAMGYDNSKIKSHINACTVKAGLIKKGSVTLLEPFGEASYPAFSNPFQISGKYAIFHGIWDGLPCAIKEIKKSDIDRFDLRSLAFEL